VRLRNRADPRPSILTVRVPSDPTRHLCYSPNINQMSASTSKAGESEPKPQENLPNLGVLEEDDEFEEFAVAGQLKGYMIMISSLILPFKPIVLFSSQQIGTIRKQIWLILEEHNLEQRSLEETNSGKTIGMMMILRMNSAFN
jgi:hypothetical protein